MDVEKNVASKKPTVFISYCQRDGNAYADDLETELSDYFTVKRDKTKLIPNDDIYDFMAEIANEDYVVIVLTEGYVKSKNCMLEMAYLAEQEDWSEKAMILVIDETIYCINRKIEILEHWKAQKKQNDLLIEKESVGKDILNQEKEYLDCINKRLEFFLLGISRRLNPSQITIVNELARKARNYKRDENPAIVEGEQRVKEYLKNNGEKTMTEISDELNMSKASSTRVVRKLLDSAELEQIYGAGTQRTYRLRDR